MLAAPKPPELVKCRHCGSLYCGPVRCRFTMQEQGDIGFTIPASIRKTERETECWECSSTINLFHGVHALCGGCRASALQEYRQANH